jgi:hypothetical protein
VIETWHGEVPDESYSRNALCALDFDFYVLITAVSIVVLVNVYCFKFQLIALVNIFYNLTRVLIDIIIVYQ